MSYGTIDHYVGDETLIVRKCWCGLLHAIPKSLDRIVSNGEHSVYCPLGHKGHVGETETDRLKKKLSLEQDKLCRERAHHDQTRAELEDTEKRRRAQKGAKTRIMNRVARGVCPCCNRSFSNLHAHMKTKHPDYVKESDNP